MLSRLSPKFFHRSNRKILNNTSPESYWVLRGEDVIGKASLNDLEQGRQIDTYNAIYTVIKSRSVSQVIDLGCNIATMGYLLYYWGYLGSYIGVDSNPYALKIAHKHLASTAKDCHLVNANIRALPFKNRLFSCIVMKDVLEHMQDFRPLLSEAARVSSDYVIIANFIPWTEGKTIIRRESQGYYHNMYNRYEVYAFANILGLEVEEVLSALEKNARPNEIVVFRRQSFSTTASFSHL